MNQAKIPIPPEVRGDVGVEVGVAVVQGEGEGEEEPPQAAQDTPTIPQSTEFHPPHSVLCTEIAKSLLISN